MIYPESLKVKDKIGVSAPSAGLAYKPEVIKQAMDSLKECGYSLKLTKNVYSTLLISSSVKQRVQQLNELVLDPKVKTIMIACGGDFLMEMLPKVDWEAIQEHPKWIMGMSDPSTLLFILPTKYDIATLYGANFSSFARLKLGRPQKDALRLLSGQMITQKSYRYYQPDINADHYDQKFDTPVSWETPNGAVETKGRMIGGCIDALRDIVGTPLDGVPEFIERYKEDGIIWFFDDYALSSEDFYHTLFQMKLCGWFKYTAGVILGRVLFPKTSTPVNYKAALRKIFGNRMPLIMEADIGHTDPAMSMIVGGYAIIKAGNGTGSITFVKR